MLRLLYADLYYALNNKAFPAGLIIIAAYDLLTTLTLKLIAHFMGADIAAEEMLTAYPYYAPLFIAAFTLSIFLGGFSDGTIRNRMICGAKRHDVILSAMIAGGLLSGFYTVFSHVICLICAPLLTTGYLSMTVPEIADYCIITVIASIAVGCFCTMIHMILGGTKASYFAALVLTFLFTLANSETADKLYPENGECLLSGARLQLYSMYHKYCSFAHFGAPVLYPFSCYMTGALVLIALSVTIGVIIYRYKEFK